MSDTITITLTDSVTLTTATATADFMVGQVAITSPGDQNGTVGTPI